jgi:hypothetical protein
VNQVALPVVTRRIDVGESKGQSLLYTLLGFNRAGTFLYLGVAALVILGFGVWKIEVPRWRFSDQDERLFRAARHGDVTGIEQALTAGGGVNDASPSDGKTALFRAAVFGHADAVRTLLTRGADPAFRGYDGLTALEVVTAARGEEKDPLVAQRLDRVAAVLGEVER